MKIVDLQQLNTSYHEALARLLMQAFAKNYPNAWPDLPSAVEEVEESLADDRISRVALDDTGEVIGWIGGESQYDGHVWELHPLAVKSDHQGRGIGRALVNDFERCVHERGGGTILLGTDDESGLTSLSGQDLYPDPLKYLAGIQNYGDHPFTFYIKMGFVVVGVIPDANGFGKPDILMAKKVNFS